MGSGQQSDTLSYNREVMPGKVLSASVVNFRCKSEEPVRDHGFAALAQPDIVVEIVAVAALPD